MPEFNYAKGRISDSLQFIATEIKNLNKIIFLKAGKITKRP